MKKLLFIVITLFLLMGIPLQAQVKREGNTFKSEQTSSQDTQTKYTWEDKEGNKHPIFITKKGACYIFKTSKKSGKEYKQYLPKEVQEQIKKELNHE